MSLPTQHAERKAAEGPITWIERFTQTVERLTGARPPQKLVKEWVNHESGALQDWVGSTEAFWWAQNIGILDAAEALASQPCEGEHDIDYTLPAALNGD